MLLHRTHVWTSLLVGFIISLPITVFCEANACNPDSEFQCRDSPNVCIPLARIQDGVRDCPDGSDEECLATQFDCVTGSPKCLEASRVNDGRVDCQNGRDEGCPEAYFVCADRSACIPPTHVGDGKLHCHDGSDEGSCGEDHFQCRSGECIPKLWFQDGLKDCPDGSDEECLPHQHRCLCGKPRCLDPERVGDGVLDCLEGSDEVEIDENNFNCPLVEENEMTQIKRSKRQLGPEIPMEFGGPMPVFIFTPVMEPTGLLSSTVDTMVLGGITTLFATELYGTYDPNGQYLQFVKTRARVLPKSDPVSFLTPTESFNSDGVLHTAEHAFDVQPRPNDDFSSSQESQIVEAFNGEDGLLDFTTSSLMESSTTSRMEVFPTVFVSGKRITSEVQKDVAQNKVQTRSSDPYRVEKLPKASDHVYPAYVLTYTVGQKRKMSTTKTMGPPEALTLTSSQQTSQVNPTDTSTITKLTKNTASTNKPMVRHKTLTIGNNPQLRSRISLQPPSPPSVSGTPTPTGRSLNLIQTETTKKTLSKRTRITIKGFVHFTTTVSGTEIIFMPQTTAEQREDKVTIGSTQTVMPTSTVTSSSKTESLSKPSDAVLISENMDEITIGSHKDASVMSSKASIENTPVLSSSMEEMSSSIIVGTKELISPTLKMIESPSESSQSTLSVSDSDNAKLPESSTSIIVDKQMELSNTIASDILTPDIFSSMNVDKSIELSNSIPLDILSPVISSSIIVDKQMELSDSLISETSSVDMSSSTLDKQVEVSVISSSITDKEINSDLSSPGIKDLPSASIMISETLVTVEASPTFTETTTQTTILDFNSFEIILPNREKTNSTDLEKMTESVDSATSPFSDMFDIADLEATPTPPSNETWDDEELPLGLISSTEGTSVNDGTTTHFTTIVIGTMIDGNYAQIIQSTSSLLFTISGDASTSSTSDIAPSKTSFTTLTHYKTIMQGDFPFVTSDLEIISQVVPETPSVNTLPLSSSINEDATTFSQFSTIVQGDFTLGTSASEVISNDFTDKELSIESKIQGSSVVESGTTTFEHFTIITDGLFPFITSGIDVIQDESTAIASSIMGEKENSETTLTQFSTITSGEFSFVTSKLDIISESPLLDYAQNTLSSLFTHYSTIFRGNSFSVISEVVTNTMKETITSTVGQDNSESRATDELDSSVKSQGRSINSDPKSQLFSYQTIRRNEPQSLLKEPVDTSSTTILIPLDIDSTVFTQFSTISDGSFPIPISSEEIIKNTMTKLPNDDIQSSETRFTQFSTTIQGDFPVVISSEEIVSEKKETTISESNSSVNAENIESVFTQFTTLAEGDFVIATSKIEDINSVQIDSTSTVATVSSNNNNDVIKDSLTSFTDFTTVSQENFPLATSIVEVLGDNSTNSVEITDTSKFLKTSFTTFTHFTTSFQGEFPFVTSNLEIVSNLVSEKIDESEIITEITRTDFFFTRPSEVRQNSSTDFSTLSNTSATESTTYLTFTHFTTFLVGNETSIDGREVIVTNIVPIESSESINNMSPQVLASISPTSVVLDSSVKISSIMSVINQPSMEDRADRIAEIPTDGAEASGLEIQIEKPDGFVDARADSLDSFETVTTTQTYYTTFFLDGSTSLVSREVIATSIVEKTPLIPVSPKEENLISSLELQSIPELATSSQLFNTFTYYTTFIVSGATSISSSVIVIPVDPSFSSSAIIATPTLFAEITPVVGSHASNIIVIPFPNSHEIENGNTNTVLQANSEQYTVPTSMFINAVTQLNNNNNSSLEHEQEIDKSINEVGTMINMEMPSSTPQPDNILNNYTNNFNYSSATLGESQDKSLESSMFGSTLDNTNPTSKLFSLLKTLYTTYTYYTTFISNGTSSTTTRKQTVSNIITDPILTPIPAAPVKTYYTTYTYYTTFIKDGNTSVTSRKVTESNVISDAIQITSTPHPEISPTYPVTQYTTFTYFTTSYQDGSTILKSNEEVKSTIYTNHEQFLNAKTDLTTPDLKSSNSLEPSSSAATIYTTFTYYTTSYNGDQTFVTSRLETTSSVVSDSLSPFLSSLTEITFTPSDSPAWMFLSPTSTLESVSSSSSSPSEAFVTVVDPFSDLIATSSSQSIGLLSSITSTNIRDGLTTAYTTAVYGTILDGLYTSIFHSSSSVFVGPQTSSDNDIITVSPIQSNEPQLAVISPTSATTSSYPTGLVSSTTGSIVNDGTITLFTSRVIGTYIDGTYGQIIESTSRIVLGQATASNVQEKVEPTATPTPDFQDIYIIGLVSNIPGSTEVRDGLTTLHETQVIGTYIEGSYAQILSPTTRILSDKIILESTPSFVSSESVLSTSSLSTTSDTVLTSLQEPVATPKLESEVNSTTTTISSTTTETSTSSLKGPLRRPSLRPFNTRFRPFNRSKTSSTSGASSFRSRITSTRSSTSGTRFYGASSSRGSSTSGSRGSTSGFRGSTSGFRGSTTGGRGSVSRSSSFSRFSSQSRGGNSRSASRSGRISATQTSNSQSSRSKFVFTPRNTRFRGLKSSSTQIASTQESSLFPSTPLDNSLTESSIDLNPTPPLSTEDIERLTLSEEETADPQEEETVSSSQTQEAVSSVKSFRRLRPRPRVSSRSAVTITRNLFGTKKNEATPVKTVRKSETVFDETVEDETEENDKDDEEERAENSSNRRQVVIRPFRPGDRRPFPFANRNRKLFRKTSREDEGDQEESGSELHSVKEPAPAQVFEHAAFPDSEELISRKRRYADIYDTDNYDYETYDSQYYEQPLIYGMKEDAVRQYQRPYRSTESLEEEEVTRPVRPPRRKITIRGRPSTKPASRSQVSETKSRAQETKSRAQETKSRAQETKSRAQESKTRAQETKSRAQETTEAETIKPTRSASSRTRAASKEPRSQRRSSSSNARSSSSTKVRNSASRSLTQSTREKTTIRPSSTRRVITRSRPETSRRVVATRRRISTSRSTIKRTNDQRTNTRRSRYSTSFKPLPTIITVTHTLNTTKVVPIFHGRETEIRTLHTTTLSEQILHPNDYTAMERNGNTVTILSTTATTDNITPTLTYVTEVLITSSLKPTTTITRLRGGVRDTRTSTLLVYGLSTVVNTNTPQLEPSQPANPLASLFLSQLLLNQFFPNQQQVTVSTSTYSYVVTTTITQSSIIPLVFRDKTKYSTLTERKVLPSTITTTTTVPVTVNPSFPPINPLFPLFNPLQYQLLNQQFNPQLNPQLPTTEPISKERFREPETEEEQDQVPPPRKPKPEKTGPITSVLTLFLSGEKPGQFNSFITTVTLDNHDSVEEEEATRAKRAAGIDPHPTEILLQMTSSPSGYDILGDDEGLHQDLRNDVELFLMSTLTDADEFNPAKGYLATESLDSMQYSSTESQESIIESSRPQDPTSDSIEESYEVSEEKSIERVKRSPQADYEDDLAVLVPSFDKTVRPKTRYFTYTRFLTTIQSGRAVVIPTLETVTRVATNNYRYDELTRTKGGGFHTRVHEDESDSFDEDDEENVSERKTAKTATQRITKRRRLQTSPTGRAIDRTTKSENVPSSVKSLKKETIRQGFTRTRFLQPSKIIESEPVTEDESESLTTLEDIESSTDSVASPEIEDATEEMEKLNEDAVTTPENVPKPRKQKSRVKVIRIRSKTVATNSDLKSDSNEESVIKSSVTRKVVLTSRRVKTQKTALKSGELLNSLDQQESASRARILPTRPISLTYFTTFTYLSTLIVNDETQISSREAVTSHVSKETVNSALANIIQKSEGYSELPEDATPTNFGTRVRNGKTTVVYVGSRIRVHDGGSLSASRPVIKITRTRQRSSATDEVSATKSVVPSKIDHSPRTFMTIYTYFYTFVEDLATRFSSSEATYTEVSTDKATPLPDLMEKHENSAGVYTITSDSKLANLGSHILGDITTFINLGSKTLVMLGDHDLPPSSTKSLSDDSSGVTESSPISVAPPIKTRTSGRTKFRTRTRTSTSKSTELEPSYLESSTQFDIDSSTLIPTPVQEEETELITEQDDTSLKDMDTLSDEISAPISSNVLDTEASSSSSSSSLVAASSSFSSSSGRSSLLPNRSLKSRFSFSRVRGDGRSSRPISSSTSRTYFTSTRSHKFLTRSQTHTGPLPSNMIYVTYTTTTLVPFLGGTSYRTLHVVTSSLSKLDEADVTEVVSSEAPEASPVISSDLTSSQIPESSSSLVQESPVVTDISSSGGSSADSSISSSSDLSSTSTFTPSSVTRTVLETVTSTLTYIVTRSDGSTPVISTREETSIDVLTKTLLEPLPSSSLVPMARDVVSRPVLNISDSNTSQAGGQSNTLELVSSLASLQVDQKLELQTKVMPEGVTLIIAGSRNASVPVESPILISPIPQTLLPSTLIGGIGLGSLSSLTSSDKVSMSDNQINILPEQPTISDSKINASPTQAAETFYTTYTYLNMFKAGSSVITITSKSIATNIVMLQSSLSTSDFETKFDTKTYLTTNTFYSTSYDGINEVVHSSEEIVTQIAITEAPNLVAETSKILPSTTFQQTQPLPINSLSKEPALPQINPSLESHIVTKTYFTTFTYFTTYLEGSDTLTTSRTNVVTNVVQQIVQKTRPSLPITTSPIIFVKPPVTSSEVPFKLSTGSSSVLQALPEPASSDPQPANVDTLKSDSLMPTAFATKTYFTTYTYFTTFFDGTGTSVSTNKETVSRIITEAIVPSMISSNIPITSMMSSFQPSTVTQSNLNTGLATPTLDFKQASVTVISDNSKSPMIFAPQLTSSGLPAPSSSSSSSSLASQQSLPTISAISFLPSLGASSQQLNDLIGATIISTPTLISTTVLTAPTTLLLIDGQTTKIEPSNTLYVVVDANKQTMTLTGPEITSLLTMKADPVRNPSRPASQIPVSLSSKITPSTTKSTTPSTITNAAPVVNIGPSGGSFLAGVAPILGGLAAALLSGGGMVGISMRNDTDKNSLNGPPPLPGRPPSGAIVPGRNEPMIIPLQGPPHLHPPHNAPPPPNAPQIIFQQNLGGPILPPPPPPPQMIPMNVPPPPALFTNNRIELGTIGSGNAISNNQLPLAPIYTGSFRPGATEKGFTPIQTKQDGSPPITTVTSVLQGQSTIFITRPRNGIKPSVSTFTLQGSGSEDSYITAEGLIQSVIDGTTMVLALEPDHHRDRVGFSTVDYPMDPIAEGAENIEHVLALATIQPTVSTYYTTYTYFTTLFDKSTTTVTSREETVSQVKTVYPDGRTIVPSSIVLAPATVSTPAHAPSVIHLEPSQQEHIGSSFQQTAHSGEGLSNDRSIIHMGMQHSGEKNRIIPNHRPANPEQHFPHHPELRPPPMHEDSDMIIHNLPPPRPPQPDHFPSLPRPNHHEQLPHLHQPSQPEHIPLPPRQPPQPEHIPQPVNQPEHFLPQPPHHPSEPERIPLPPNHERVNLVPSPNQPDPIFIQMEPGSPPIQEGFIRNPQPQNPTHHQHLGLNIGNEKLDIDEPQFLVPSFRPNEEATLLFIPQTETRFITYTYYTTIFDAGRRMVSSREETLSTLFAATPVQGINAGPTVINIPPRRPIEFAPEVQNNGQIFLIAEQPIGGSHHEQERLPLGIQHTNTIITDKADVSQIEIEKPSKVEVQTRIPGLSSRLLTFTYYTTMLHENGQRIVTSREETLTQVFTPSTEAQLTHSTSKVTVNDEQTVIRVDGSLPDNILSNLLSASGATIIPITSAPPVPSRTVIHIQATPTVQSSVISIRKEESVRVVSSPVSLQASHNAMVSTRFITFTSYTTFFKDGTKTVSTSELVVPTLITVQVTDRKDVISSSTIIASISPTQAISPTPTVSPSPSSSFIPEVLSSVQIESSSLVVSSVLSPTPTILTLGTLISSSIGTDGIVMDKPHMRTYFTTYTYYTTFLKDGSIPVVSTKMETLSRSEVITPTQSIQVSSPIVTESIKVESPSQPSISVASASTVYRTRTLLFTSFFGPGSSSVSASEQIYSIIVPIAPTRVVLYQDGSFHTRPAAGGGAVHSLPGQIVSSVIFGGRTVLYLANGAFTTSIDASQLQTTLVNGQKTFFVRPTPTSQVGVTTAPTIGGSNNNGISLAPTLGGSINSGSTLPATTVRGSVSNAEGGKGGVVAIGGNKPAEVGSATDENKTTFIGAGSTIVSGATTIFGEMFTRPVEIGGGPKVQYSNAERIESISGIITRYITRVDSSSRTIVSTKPTMIGLTSTNVVNTNVYPPRTMVITVVGDKSTNIRYVNGEQQPLDPSELREIFGTTTIAQPPAIEITPTNDPASDPSVLVQAGFGGNGRATTTPTTTTKSSKTASIQALDSKCKPGCNIAGYEICKEISVDKGRCECRDGYARNTKTKKCELVRTYLVQVALMKKDKQNLVYKDSYRNTKSFEFRDIATGTNRGADQVFQASEAVERYYRGNKIINITAPEAPNKGIVANMAVHVSNNSAVDELMLRNELDKWARANNFTLGKTNLVTSGAGGSLKVTDFDECSHPDFNDCHQNANCINTPGSFICKCEGNFQDDDHVFPGRVCIDTTCDFCSRHGSCVMSEYGHRVCKCHNWYLGKNCQVNGYALAIILPIIAGLLLLAAIIWLCCCCHKRNGCCGCCEKRHTPTAAAVATTGVFPILGGGVGAGTLDKKAMIAGDTSSESSGEQSRLAHIADVFGGAGTHKSRKSGQSYEDRSMSGFVTEAPVLIPRAKHQHPKQYVSASTENMMAASSADHADYAGAESKLISILEADARHERNMAIHKENSSFATLPGSGKGKMHSVGNRAATIERSDHQMNRSSAMASAASGRHSSQSASKMSVSSGMEKRSGMMSGSSAVSSAAAAGAAAAAAALGSVSRTEKSRGGKGESSYYSSQEASSSHHMESYGGGKMDGYGGSKMEGYGGSKMEGYGGSKMEGYGGSKMEGYGTSKLGAMDTQRSRSTVYRDAREQADIDTFSSRFETASTGRYGNTTTMSVARSFDETTIHPDTKRLGASSYYGSSKGRSSHFQENFRTDMDDGITDVSVSTMMIPNSQIYYEHDSDASDSTPSAIMPKVYTRHKGANNYDRKSYYSYDNKIEIDSTYPESHT